MANKKTLESEPNAEQATFTKEQIVSAKKYIHNKDVVNVVLKNNQAYTLEQVDELIEKFMKGQVK